MSLIEKIVASFTTEWLTDEEKRTLAQAALTAIMGEGDGVQQCDKQCAFDIITGQVGERARVAARHRSTAATAERARIVALEDALETMGNPEVSDIEIEDALKAEGIYVWGLDGERFCRMFAIVMKLRADAIERGEV